MDAVRTAIVDERDVVAAGIAALLERAADRLVVVPVDDPAGPEVVLYGLQEHRVGHDAALHSLVRGSAATVLALGWNEESEQAQLAVACGARGFVSLQLTGPDLVERVLQLHRGRPVRVAAPATGHCHPGIDRAGLTTREAQVLALIGAGLTNQEIADRLFLGINSVKTYIRQAYRKIAVSRRSQAVIWVQQHGLVPEVEDLDAAAHRTG